MSTKDFIKKSVLNAFTQYDAPKLAVALLAALALGILIYLVYRKFYTGVVYSRSFAVTLVGMCVLTCMVTLAISTNVVISLGMVGALSIVRTEAGDDIVRALGRIKYAVKSKTMRGENTEMAVEVFCKDPNMEFADRIRAVKGVQDVTLIQYNGEYHG